jgi:hypothetical protein
MNGNGDGDFRDPMGDDNMRLGRLTRRIKRGARNGRRSARKPRRR